MRIGITAVQVPFIRGGAEILAEGLLKAIREIGHEAEKISMPFRFAPLSEVKRSMDIWETENFEYMNGYLMDVVICLQFPTFYLNHPSKVIWLTHQHRPVYDLWDTPFVHDLSLTTEGKALRQDIIERDNKALGSCQKIFTIAKTVSDRMQYFNQISSTPLYHPPALANYFYHAAAQPFIFFPSRLEQLKRQDLLIKAMSYVKSPVVALIAGDGGTKHQLLQMIEELGLTQQVRLIGRLTDEEMLAYYAHCLGVFFAPYNEDYGYVTLEAMLAAKPVITCKDSGGPLEFLINRQTGLVLEPEPEVIGEAIDYLYNNQTDANEMGQAGLARYKSLDISWENVIEQLVLS